MADRFETVSTSGNEGIRQKMTDQTTHYRVVYADSAEEGATDTGNSLFLTRRQAANRGIREKYHDMGDGSFALERDFR